MQTINHSTTTTQTQLGGAAPTPPEAHQGAVGEEQDMGNGLSATYSPEDNKLRLYSVSRLPKELYERVHGAGFKWAPKQEVFIAPMWTPEREDLLLELCGGIEDEGSTLAERAEQRAERFEGYSEIRAHDAHAARRAVDAIADHIPFGQPILVGHHSERHARKDAQRIEHRMRKAISMWETAEYWKRRAVGSLRHAEYKELPAVRHRRIKGLEADKRKQERALEEAELFMKLWQVEDLTLEKAKTISNHGYVSRCFPLAEFPRDEQASQYEGAMSLWSAMNGGVIDQYQARAFAIEAYSSTIERATRWARHYDNRITYERAMLDEQGGVASDKFNIEVGGRVLVRGEWLVVLRVNKKGGVINSVTTSCRYVSVKGIEEVTDYRAPSVEDAAKVKAAKKLPPLVNYPGEGFLHMTKAEYEASVPKWSDFPKIGTITTPGTARHRVKQTRKSGGQFYETAQVFLTDAKRIDPPAAETAAPVQFERQSDLATVQTRTIETPKSAEAESFDAMREQLKQGVQVVAAPQLFPTPAALAARMVELAHIAAGARVLEPSAGTGAILSALPGLIPFGPVRQTWCKVTAVEVNRQLADVLERTGLANEVICADFLECGSLGGFDVALMNPPFANGQDIAHIKHALAQLKPGGMLVAICANGPRQNDQLRPLVEQHGGTWEVLPAGTFADTGTNVNTVLLSLSVA